MHVFDIWTSQSGGDPSVLYTFDLFCTFLLGNVLRFSTSFSTSQLLKVLRSWDVLCILTRKCASHHNGVHFFHISTSKRAPNACFFFFPFLLSNVLRATSACIFLCLIWQHGSAPAALASLLFDPPERQIIGKKSQWIATFLPFSHAPASSSFSLFLLSDLLSSSLLLSDSSHLCFPPVYTVGSFTSKLPSAIHIVCGQPRFTRTLKCETRDAPWDAQKGSICSFSSQVTRYLLKKWIHGDLVGIDIY